MLIVFPLLVRQHCLPTYIVCLLSAEHETVSADSKMNNRVSEGVHTLVGRFLEQNALKDWVGIQQANCNVDGNRKGIGRVVTVIQKQQHGEKQGSMKAHDIFPVVSESLSSGNVFNIGFKLLCLEFQAGCLPRRIRNLLWVLGSGG